MSSAVSVTYRNMFVTCSWWDCLRGRRGLWDSDLTSASYPHSYLAYKKSGSTTVRRSICHFTSAAAVIILARMLLKGRILTTLSSLRTAYSPQLAAVLPEAGRIEDAASQFLKAVQQTSRAPFSAQPAYASDEDSEPEITLEPRPITPDTR